MTNKANLRIAATDASAGAVPDVETGPITVVVGALLVAVCFAAPLLLTLPQTMDAAASAGPSIREVAVTAAPEATFHERYPGQPSVDWTDSLDESSLAEWRMRASD